jgi:hypothetical protein
MVNKFFRLLDEKIENKESRGDILDYVIDVIDNMCYIGIYHNCDKILNKYDVNKYDINISVCLLMLTFKYKKKLKNREDFYYRLKNKIDIDYKDKKENVAEKILNGLL